MVYRILIESMIEGRHDDLPAGAVKNGIRFVVNDMAYERDDARDSTEVHYDLSLLETLVNGIRSPFS